MVKKIIDVPFFYEAEVMLPRSRRSKMANILSHFQWEVEDHNTSPETIMEWNLSREPRVFSNDTVGSLHYDNDTFYGKIMKPCNHERGVVEPYTIEHIKGFSDNLINSINTEDTFNMYGVRQDDLFPEVQYFKLVLDEDNMLPNAKILGSNKDFIIKKAMENMQDFALYNGELYQKNKIPFIHRQARFINSKEEVSISGVGYSPIKNMMRHHVRGVPLHLCQELFDDDSGRLKIYDQQKIANMLSFDDVRDIQKNNIIRILTYTTPHRAVENKWKMLKPMYDYLRTIKEKEQNITADDVEFFQDYVRNELFSEPLQSILRGYKDNYYEINRNMDYPNQSVILSFIHEIGNITDIITQNDNVEKQWEALRASDCPSLLIS